mmetsp:Transcript_3770/g.10633  ORF Transcript_3770/g.10633 Transcript_3770/m.10633 type:complete len:238 (-) Transcript_3770:1190-1903(-)
MSNVGQFSSKLMAYVEAEVNMINGPSRFRLALTYQRPAETCREQGLSDGLLVDDERVKLPPGCQANWHSQFALSSASFRRALSARRAALVRSPSSAVEFAIASKRCRRADHLAFSRSVLSPLFAARVLHHCSPLCALRWAWRKRTSSRSSSLRTASSFLRSSSSWRRSISTRRFSSASCIWRRSSSLKSDSCLCSRSRIFLALSLAAYPGMSTLKLLYSPTMIGSLDSASMRTSFLP